MRAEINIKNTEIEKIIFAITGEKNADIFQFCEKSDKNEIIRRYDTYKVILDSRVFILKKSNPTEASNYEKYLTGHGFKVPDYIGKYVTDDGVYILIGNIDGEDMRDMTREKALAVAETLASYQNAFMSESQNRDNERYIRYMKRIEKRAESVKNNKLLYEAYSLFIARQEVCPLTLSNGDLMQFNVIWHDNAAYVIDWGFGGIMPYSLDIARFTAHATENRDTFPFCMSNEQKKIFVDEVYRLLNNKPDYEQYISDIRLALLNEYIEFVEADEDDDGWYFEHALKTASIILGKN